MVRKFLLLIFAAGAVAFSAHAQAQTPPRLQPKTMANLNAAYIREAKASAFYTESGRQAQRDGFPDVAKLFRAAALSEAIHRDNHRRAIRFQGETPKNVPLAKPKVKSTRDNLVESVADEREESRVIYPGYIRTAREEGSRSAERMFRFARDTERAHAKLFERALDGLGGKSATDYFLCQTCGMTTINTVPAVCPVCRGTGLDYRKVE